MLLITKCLNRQVGITPLILTVAERSLELSSFTSVVLVVLVVPWSCRCCSVSGQLLELTGCLHVQWTAVDQRARRLCVLKCRVWVTPVSVFKVRGATGFTGEVGSLRGHQNCNRQPGNISFKQYTLTVMYWLVLWALWRASRALSHSSRRTRDRVEIQHVTSRKWIHILHLGPVSFSSFSKFWQKTQASLSYVTIVSWQQLSRLHNYTMVHYTNTLGWWSSERCRIKRMCSHEMSDKDSSSYIVWVVFTSVNIWTPAAQCEASARSLVGPGWSWSSVWSGDFMQMLTYIFNNLL